MANQFCEMLNLFRLIICRLTWRPERAAILKLVPGTWSTGLGCESLWCRGTMTSRKIPSMGYFFLTAQATPRCAPRLWSMWSMFFGLRSLRHSLSSLSALVLSHLRSWLLTRYTCLFSSFFEKNPPIRCEGFADRRGTDLWTFEKIEEIPRFSEVMKHRPDTPIFGICLGNQILALAAGASTYKMRHSEDSAGELWLPMQLS